MVNPVGLPQTMRAVLQTNAFGNHLELATIRTPTINAAANEHLIRMHATSPCNNELQWWNYGVVLAPNKQFVPCFDLAGVVVEGPQDSPFKPGDKVFTRTNAARTGNAADYAVALTSELAHMPNNLTFEECASVPLSAFTAYQALFEHGGLDGAALRTGDATAAESNSKVRLLVTAASGGVGTWILQFARAAGVKDIVAVCGTSNVDFVRELGASEVIDYRKSSIQEWARQNTNNKADLVIDCIVGTDSTTQCWHAVKNGARLISLVKPPGDHKPTGDDADNVAENVTPIFFIMEPRGEELEVVRQLLEAKKCRPIIDSVFPFEDFQAAFDRVAGGHAKGKVILKVLE
ncbi:hypothetical protein LTS10_011264 [Elasticomyces elasticus]|nr:hypothetical protein LTS10_011264 [Elasticomyces elasticus]